MQSYTYWKLYYAGQLHIVPVPIPNSKTHLILILYLRGSQLSLISKDVPWKVNFNNSLVKFSYFMLHPTFGPIQPPSSQSCGHDVTAQAGRSVLWLLRSQSHSMSPILCLVMMCFDTIANSRLVFFFFSFLLNHKRQGRFLLMVISDQDTQIFSDIH